MPNKTRSILKGVACISLFVLFANLNCPGGLPLANPLQGTYVLTDSVSGVIETWSITQDGDNLTVTIKRENPDIGFCDIISFDATVDDSADPATTASGTVFEMPVQITFQFGGTVEQGADVLLVQFGENVDRDRFELSNRGIQEGNLSCPAGKSNANFLGNEGEGF